MEQHDRKSPREWAEIIADWQESGKSQREYCLLNSIKFSTFHYWKNKHRQGSKGNSLVKVSTIVPAASIGRNTPTVRVGEIEVKLSGHESEELLVRIFKALKASL